MKKIKLQDGLIITGIALIVLVNPLVGQYIVKGVIYAYEEMLMVTDYFLLVGLTLIVIGYLISRTSKKTSYNAKLKSMKQKKSKVSPSAYIE